AGGQGHRADRPPALTVGSGWYLGGMSLRIASYNILADSYIQRTFFPRTPSEILDPSRRYPTLAARVAGLAADVLCLQEVDRSRPHVGTHVTYRAVVGGRDRRRCPSALGSRPRQCLVRSVLARVGWDWNSSSIARVDGPRSMSAWRTRSSASSGGIP